ncbi:MAG: sigma-54 dependent transcriptional regulator [Polyangiales bacterium]
MATVLVVDDERGIREWLSRALTTHGHRAKAAASLAEARAALTADVDCVLLDLRLTDGDGMAFLRSLRDAGNEVPVIVATAYGDSARTIDAMRIGAFDYVTKPFDLPALLETVDRAVRQRTLAQSTPRAAEEPASPPGTLIGTSAAMLAVWKLIGRAAATDAPVLITGETGTGKELVARAVHENSRRARGPFVAVNLAALPPTLLESELFGHEKGAFTGAMQRRPGRVELAEGGTLFLDEIGDLDLPLQTRLLRVLQEQGYERVGGAETLRADVRIVAATHKPVRPGQPGATLREDLYYRLAVLELELPPLRARRSDIPLLVQHALSTTRARAVSEEAMALLQRYAWPGNVRELLHTVQRAAAVSAAEVIDAPDLPAALRESSGPRESEAGAAAAYESMPLRDALAALEKHLISRALEKAGGNRAEAARILGIARPQLYVKLEEHGLRDRE